MPLPDGCAVDDPVHSDLIVLMQETKPCMLKDKGHLRSTIPGLHHLSLIRSSATGLRARSVPQATSECLYPVLNKDPSSKSISVAFDPNTWPLHGSLRMEGSEQPNNEAAAFNCLISDCIGSCSVTSSEDSTAPSSKPTA